MSAFRLVVLLGLTGAVAACGSVPQRCPLTNRDGTCASMQETYEIARDQSGNSSGESVFDVYGSGDKDGDETFGKRSEGAPSALGNPQSQKKTGMLEIDMGRHHLAGPVYTPPRPYRIWVAPWTDSNGIVHSGEHLFFAKPGHWNYGPMGMPGVAAGLLRPAVPDDYGFDPLVPGEAGGQEEFVRPGQKIRGTTPTSAERRRQRAP